MENGAIGFDGDRDGAGGEGGRGEGDELAGAGEERLEARVAEAEAGVGRQILAGEEGDEGGGCEGAGEEAGAVDEAGCGEGNGAGEEVGDDAIVVG